MVRTHVAGLAAGFLLAGCINMAPEVKIYRLESQFDLAQTKGLLGPGPLRFQGTAFLRQQGGGVVTCAGESVFLVPVMAYTTERVKARFGVDDLAYLSAQRVQRMRFEPETPELELAARKERCDAQGNFQFSGLKPGAYYVQTTVQWSVGYSAQGGSLVGKVVLQDGQEPPRIVLTATP